MNLLRRRRAWTGLRERLCPRTHAPGEGPPGHLARVLNDDTTAGRPEGLFPLCGKDRAQLPERRLEARARQERRGGYAGKSREHDHYFPSHRNRLTGSRIGRVRRRRCLYRQTWTEIALLLVVRMSKTGDGVHLCVRVGRLGRTSPGMLRFPAAVFPAHDQITDGRSRLGTADRYRPRAEIALSTNPAGRCHILCFARAAELPPRAAIYIVRF
jgi:hypothetical protein